MDGSGKSLKKLALGKMPAGASPDEYLAAGPWCFCGQEKDFPDWEKSFTFAPEPLATPGALPRAARAAQTLCVRLVPQAAILLCPEPEKLPESYWQILLCPWLIDLCSQIIERAARCQAMREAWGNEELEVALLPQDCEFHFADEHDFTLRGSLGADFNLWLFSRLFEAQWPEKWRKSILEPINGRPPAHSGSLIAFFKEKASDLSLKMAFPKRKGMNLATALKLSEAMKRACRSPDHALDLAKAFDFGDDLAAFNLPKDLGPIMKAALPESFAKLKHEASAKRAGAPRLKIAALAFHENAAYRQKLALWRASGNRIAHIQHGGNYGFVETPCAAALTEYSQDAFFTWGWKKQGSAKGNFIPMPSFQLSAEGAWKPGEKLIFVGAEMSAYGRRLDSLPTPGQFVHYRDLKRRFFQELGPEYLPDCLYRPYFPLPGTLADADWLLPQFPGLSLCEGQLFDQLVSSRLILLDHHGTTLLEAMAAGIPVVMYWERAAWPLTEAADMTLDMLAAAKIWHDSPEGAAGHVREIWTDVAAWWNSPGPRLCRKVFRERYALTARDPAKEWLKTLENI